MAYTTDRVGPLSLTPKQWGIARYLWAFYTQNDQLPPVQHVCWEFGFASSNAGHDHLIALNRRGVIVKNACGKWKFTPAARQAMQALDGGVVGADPVTTEAVRHGDQSLSLAVF